MHLRKIVLVIVAAIFLATPALAGNIPEFDAVGQDSTNFFAAQSLPYQMVIVNNLVLQAAVQFRLNDASDWTIVGLEGFTQTAGTLLDDVCYGPGVQSALTDVWNEGSYTWRIVLQMKPESDINLNIYDCVMKHNEFNLWTGAEQTGRYRASSGQLFFVPSANPSITARAFPGEFATPGFPAGGFVMDARPMPGLIPSVSLDGMLYTSKAHWYEGLVMALPETGGTNAAGEATFNLKQGDIIEVTVTVPGNNSADIRYGEDNVLLKYIGIVGTPYFIF